jgi:MFS transporter, ACS family, tartrate transporter
MDTTLPHPVGTPVPAVPVAAPMSDVERAAFDKIARRFMPILIVSYVLNYLDRTNISFAALTMQDAIGLTGTQLGIGAGIFFAGYSLLEVPSNLALYKVGARRWICRIMISWGIVSAAMALAVGPNSFYFLRFALGAAEAGFFPGVAFFLATWFPAEYRTRIIAWFMVAIPLSSVVGGPLSGVLLALDGVGGLAGWQWLFIAEGLPVVLVGLVLLRFLSDRPEDTTWLTAEEKRLIRARLESEKRPKEVKLLWPALRDIRVLALAGVQFGFLVGSYGIGIFLPRIVQQGVESSFNIGLVTSACYAAACVGMILWARHVDHGASKITHLSLACVLAAVGFLGAIVFVDNFWLSIVWMAVALVGVNGARAIFWTIPPRFLTGVAAAGGLAFINSIGTTGGFVGPTIMGWLRDTTGSYSAGLLAMSGFLLAAAGLAASLKLHKHGE